MGEIGRNNNSPETEPTFQYRSGQLPSQDLPFEIWIHGRSAARKTVNHGIGIRYRLRWVVPR